MGEKGDEVQLLGFLNAVLGRTGEDRFTSVEILENKTFTPQTIGDKSVTFDIRAVLQDKTRVNVEVQLRNQHNMDKRSLYYWGKEYVTSIKEGEDYLELPDVIAINIVDFDYLPSRNFHTCFHLREDRERNIILTNSLEIHFINMVKYHKGLRSGSKAMLNELLFADPLIRWLAWFDEDSPPELIAEVKKMDSAIVAAADRLGELLANEDVVRFYDMRFKAMCDWTSAQNYATKTGYAEGHAAGLADGHAEGLAAGLAEGMEAEKLEIARKMKVAGLPSAEIAVFTGLSPEAINKLSSE
jgi:predicted transposase/invertase (TIGR01784 family)